MAEQAVIKQYAPPSGGNYSENVGLIVYLSAANEVTLQTDAADVGDGGGDFADSFSLGIIVSAENYTDGQVSVCISGPCKVKLGDTFTAGTTTRAFFAAADSRADPAVDEKFICGFLLGRASGADGELADCVVAPQKWAT